MARDPAAAMSGRRRDLVSPLDLVDVLVNVVVLNLAVQFVPSVITETFTLSLLTAVLLKVVLEVVVAGKGVVVSRLRGATTPLGKVAGGVALWLVAVGSKFLVLELVAVVFQGSVQLGGFLPVTLLIITLLVSRTLVRRYLVPTSSAVG